MKGKLKSFFEALGYLLIAFIIQLSVSIIGGIALSFGYMIKQIRDGLSDINDQGCPT